MKSFYRVPWLAAVLVILGLGCANSPTLTPLPQYEVQREKLKNTPPAPVPPKANIKASAVVPDAVRISPEKAVGYKNLPTTVTQIYDAPPRDLSILDVVTQTLANNRTIKIEGYTLRIAEYQIPVSKGIYDLLVGGSAQYNRTETQASTAAFGSLPVTSSRTASGSLSLSQLLPTGATFNFAYDVIHTSTMIPTLVAIPGGTGAFPFAIVGTTDREWQNRATFGITQPLLRGFGPTVTNANIRIAQLERQGTAADFQTQLELSLQNALLTYWDLIGALEAYKVNVIAYSAALDLLRINSAKLAAGVVPRTDVLQAEAAAEDRRNLLIQARELVRNTEDQLKRQIFLQEGRPLWESEIRPTQPIGWREMDVDLDKTIAAALELRPELRRDRSNIAQNDVNLKVARNNLLPQLNAFGNVQPNGLDQTYGRSFDTMSDANYTNYTAGLQFQYPLQNRSARYQFKQAGTRHAQAEEQLRDLQDQITLDVRLAVRDLRTARDRITVTQSQIRAEEVKLAAETRRYEVGISTAYQVLQFQGDLANAQVSHIRAVLDYNQAAIRLERAQGTLLRTYGVQVAGAELNPSAPPVLFPIGLN